MTNILKTIFLFVLLALASAAPMSNDDYQTEFIKFIDKHNRHYSHDEYHIRFNIFKENFDHINRHNERYERGEVSWKMSMNEFTDIQWYEFKEKYIGLLSKKNTHTPSKPEYDSSVLPDTFDWTIKGVVTPVKNQQQCGSCWAFSVTGSTEGAWFLKTGKLVSLSEQQLVDCSKPEGNKGCEGGLMDDGFKYIEEHGLCTESSYPYKATDRTCQTGCKSTVNVTSFVDVTPNDEDALQKAVYHTPVSVAVCATDSFWQFYSSGIITSSCCTNLDHGVLAVGWGTENNIEYWKVKNSWGITWGDKGYILLERGTNKCGIAKQSSYPVI